MMTKVFSETAGILLVLLFILYVNNYLWDNFKTLQRADLHKFYELCCIISWLYEIYLDFLVYLDFYE